MIRFSKEISFILAGSTRSCLVLSLFMAGCEASPPPHITDPGQLLFLGYTRKEVNCARCHGADGRGGTDGPDIRGIHRKYSDDEIEAIIRGGKDADPEMPAFEGKIDDQQMSELMAFLRTLARDDSLAQKVE